MDFRIQLGQVRGRALQRRWFFRECGVGLAGIAATSLLARDGWTKEAENPLAPKAPISPRKLSV